MTDTPDTSAETVKRFCFDTYAEPAEKGAFVYYGDYAALADTKGG